MNLQQYVDAVQQQLLIAAEAGGDEARALAARLAAPLDAVVRLTVQEALAAAAEEITCDLAPGSVELRLRGRDPEFVVVPPPGPEPSWPAGPAGMTAPPVPAAAPAGDEGGTARINLRLPDQLKTRVEAAAGRDGLSVNAYLVRAAAAAVDQPGPGPAPASWPAGADRVPAVHRLGPLARNSPSRRPDRQ